MNEKKRLPSEKTLEDEYNLLMKDFQKFPMSIKWEKNGENYKEFSLYDTSKYETIVSSNVYLKEE